MIAGNRLSMKTPVADSRVLLPAGRAHRESRHGRLASVVRQITDDGVDEIAQAGREERQFRAIVPCGPKCWYAPFAEYINKNRINMKHLVVKCQLMKKM